MTRNTHLPVRRGDVLELPAPVTQPAPGEPGRTGKGRTAKAALFIGAGLALLSAFIPLSAQEAEAATLYVSGGGGGQGSGGGSSGNGGGYAGAGEGYIGGGAYVGVDGNGTSNAPNGSTWNTSGGKDPALGSGATAGDGETISPGTGGHGGDAAFSAGSFSGYDVRVESGHSGTGTGPGTGGNANFRVTDTLSGGLNYTFIKNGGALSVDIGTLNATNGNVAFTVDNTAAANVRIGTLELGDGRTFTLIRDNSGDVTINAYTVRGEAAFTGDLNAAGKAMNFYIPATMGNGETMLTVDGAADITGAAVNVGIDGASSLLQVGDQVVLIDAGTLTGNQANNAANGQGMQGVTLRYLFDLTTAGDQLLATVSGIGPQVNEQTKALSEGFLAGLILANQGADLVAGQGMRQAVNAGGNGLGAFGALAGGWSRYNTGSHVDMSSITLLTGLAYGVDTAPGRLTLGAFFEFGNGSYDTYNSFSTAASVNGDGDAYYLGGGVLGRMDFANTGPGRFYAEGSARIGSLRDDYNGGDLRDAMGRSANYDSSSLYYGLHLGTGYLWNVNEKASLDLYAKYFWTRLEGDSVTLSTDDPVRFKDADSHRLRGGARFSYAVNEWVSPYVGAAYEHEFDGKARATTNGFSIDAPDIKGGTGIGEVGLTLKPSQALPLSFDLGLQGYVGKREGVTGSLQVKFEF